VRKYISVGDVLRVPFGDNHFTNCRVRYIVDGPTVEHPTRVRRTVHLDAPSSHKGWIDPEVDAYVDVTGLSPERLALYDVLSPPPGESGDEDCLACTGPLGLHSPGELVACAQEMTR
jgi:hypothetical protein